MVRTALSPAEVDEVWRRWRSGQAVKALSREMRRHPSTVRDLLKRTGGIRPVPRCRWELRLSLAEREEISRGLAAGESLRAIAGQLGRAPSTVSREVAGNGGRGGYRAVVADRVAWVRAARPKPTKLSRWPGLRAMVEDKLELCWSPEQIAGVAAPAVPDRDSDARVARDDLPVAVRAGPRRPATRADRPPAHRTGDAPPGRSPVAGRARGPPEHPEHLPTTRRSSGSGGARALGRRPGLRSWDEPGRDPGRALHPLPDAGRAARRAPRRAGRRRPGRGDHHAAAAADPVA